MRFSHDFSVKAIFLWYVSSTQKNLNDGVICDELPNTNVNGYNSSSFNVVFPSYKLVYQPH